MEMMGNRQICQIQDYRKNIGTQNKCFDFCLIDFEFIPVNEHGNPDRYFIHGQCIAQAMVFQINTHYLAKNHQGISQESTGTKSRNWYLFEFNPFTHILSI